MKRSLFTLGFLISFITAFSHVGLDYPEGGENFHPGQTISIEWHIIISHNTMNWDLYFSDDGGENWQEIALDIDVGTLSYDWTVPDDVTDQGRIKVVMDNVGGNYEDESGDFSITETSGVATTKQPLFDLYPNPAHDFVVISSIDQKHINEMKLLNSANQVLKTIKLTNNQTGNEVQHISLADYPRGIYYLWAKTDKRMTIEKILKY